MSSTAADARIVELETDDELAAGFPVLQELRDHLTEETFREYLGEMRADGEGYHLFACYESEDADPAADPPVGVVGVSVHTNFYYGRHAFIYDLVVTEGRRGEGFGSRLISEAEEWARDQDCETLVLESGLWRDDAHRFYDDNDFEKFCYSFKKELE